MAAGAAWDAVPIHGNVRCRQRQPSQAFTADVPVKSNSSQLRRLASVKACDGCCCWRRAFSCVGAVSRAVLAAVSRVVRCHMRTRLNPVTNYFIPCMQVISKGSVGLVSEKLDLQCRS